ncbi:LPS-assembly protein LptD [Spongiibacter taiwanensis]|uniref:LPS-assembly protein LptD n=1 Tax=Spongiibacter taiwanensis TaxID=1748242 RepID=UPI00203602D9|nr:LPS-assembly protein LptD [Spongiibacter taiwanensis]USA43896.1 LPS-assembly protein LptD [Spongiibacter taiwanensis]
MAPAPGCDSNPHPIVGELPADLPEYYRHWNWLPNDYLAPNQRCETAPGCEGRFVEPRRDWPGADTDPIDAPLNVSAGTIESVGPKATMTGEVELRKGSLSLDAGYAQYDRANSTVVLRDNVVLRQPGVLLRGQYAKIDTNRGLGELEQAEILAYDAGARGAAGRIARPDATSFLLEQASYTQCTPDKETWSLHADEIRLDYESGRGVARDTVVRIYDIPVFYTPYLNFPVDDRRATGFLFPTFGVADGSLDISVPYYINLAPNYDLTLAPRFIEQRGEALETEFRYLNPYSEWEINTGYLANDQKEDIDRWLLGVNEQGFINDEWETEIDFTRVSDEDYFTDLGLANLAVKRSTHLNQQAAMHYRANNWHGTVEVQRYQTIAAVDDPYQKLPQLGLTYVSPAKNFALEPSLEVEYTEFDHRDSIADGGTNVTGQRLYGAAGVSLPMRWRWGFIEPAYKSRHVAYDLEDASSAGLEENPAASSAQFTLDAGMYFERPLNFQEQAWTQTLEPRVFYRYSEYEDQSDQPDFDSSALTFTYQQLFRDTRFTGHDRLDDADQVAVGVSSRFINNDVGREMLTVSVGQLYYFNDGRVQLPGDEERRSSNSDLATQVRFLPHDNHWFSTDMLLDARQGMINQSNLSYHLRSDEGVLFNVGYTFRREGNQFGGLESDIRQADASLSLPINNQWKVFAKTQYDFENSRPVENLVGAEYQNCCWLVRMVYQQALEPDDVLGSNSPTTGRTERDSAFLVEFQLKGLGGLGTAVTSALEESIFGYQSDE